ncbi:hypothetical protein SNOG_13392 [Parastagonospora nodorum SN15]|uniref:Transmembrane protein n=1 Tax=Phaeosphaeria nodorum (strain SN15 / ATCC MYA-4574 / FGSC 10173) TaxID=321614 RepID=Q0U4C2_PHANO|nr:hypothetical protein SNOG_13392 [Parastagonospora nodorum SN15]EAT79276.1 hypothetical protein SNOG_13392 [Parastagonospora nodorum SN15]
MIVSTPSFLRGVIALSSTLLTVLSGVAIYKCVFAVLLLAKSLPLDGYVWVDILGMAGSGKPEKHVVNLRLGGELTLFGEAPATGTMGEHHDATLKCTRELAICEVSPYLVKPNRSEQAVGWRQKACGQLQHSRKSLVFLALLSLVLVVGYGAQAYLARREEKMLLNVEEKTVSVRSSSDSQNRSPRSSWGSSDSQRIEKAE